MWESARQLTNQPDVVADGPSVQPERRPPLVSPTARLAPPPIQCELTVGAADDEYEREAEDVADRVMRMPEPLGGPPALQRACAGCDEERLSREVDEDDDELMRQPEEDEEVDLARAQPGSPVPAITPSVRQGVGQMRTGGGAPLPPSTRAFFEPRLGHDFSNVRVHADNRAADTARALRAKAFTFGTNIAFAPGRYAPNTSAGRRLLAHELTHVIQQTTRRRIRS